MADKDRRGSPRSSMRCTLDYIIVSNAQRRGRALTRNVSGKGVRFVAEHPLTTGAQLDFVLTVPDRREPIQFRGQVVWVRWNAEADRRELAPEVGVKFVEIAEADRRFLEQYGQLYGTPATDDPEPAG